MKPPRRRGSYGKACADERQGGPGPARRSGPGRVAEGMSAKWPSGKRSGNKEYGDKCSHTSSGVECLSVHTRWESGKANQSSRDAARAILCKIGGRRIESPWKPGLFRAGGVNQKGRLALGQASLTCWLEGETVLAVDTIGNCQLPVLP